LITFRNDFETDSYAGSSDDKRLVELDARSDRFRVNGLTHVALHQAPDNTHYGYQGNYRNCGVGGPRPRAAVRICQQAERLWLGPWNGSAPDDGPYGMSTYNPNFAGLSQHLSEFVKKVFEEQRDDQPDSANTIFAEVTRSHLKIGWGHTAPAR